MDNKALYDELMIRIAKYEAKAAESNGEAAQTVICWEARAAGIREAMNCMQQAEELDKILESQHV